MYLLLILFIIFYVFIFPFIIIIFKIIESDKFLSFKDDFMNKCLEHVPNNMNSDIRIESNNTRNKNSISIPKRNRLEIIGNNSDYTNSVTVRDNSRNSITYN